MIGGAWDTEGADRFPVGTFVRPDVSYSGTDVSPFVGRVIGTRGRTVVVRFSPDQFRRMYPNGAYNVPAEFAGASVGAYDADWLHRVVYVRTRYRGPMIGRNGYTIGARIIATGTRGNRSQLTYAVDPATSGGMSGDGSHESAALAFARERMDMCDPSAESWQDRRTGGRTYAVTEYGTCDCSDEYGPCEFHGDTLVTREGAAVRTADDLSHEFLTDVASVCGSWPSPEFEREAIRIGNALADNESYGARWLPEPDDGEDMRDTLSDMVGNAESHLAAHGLSVYWEDGYRIVRITGGPLSR